MMAINHSLTGAAVGLSVGAPEAALPLAFLSHFMLDMVPHYGSSRKSIHTASFRNLLIVDACLCSCLVLALAIIRPRHWAIAAICAFLAASPDFMWVSRFIKSRRSQITLPVKNVILRFHGRIQWFQRPIGMVVECVWALATIDVLAHLI